MAGKADRKRVKKKYLISLEETRSTIAMICSVIVFLCTLAAVFYMIEIRGDDEENALHYFTVLSNLFSATAAAMMFPYAVEGIRKKRFILPRWVVLFQFAAATCVAITMISSMAIILPTQGISSMTGYNFWLHVVTPACTVILFQCVETGIDIRFKEVLIPLIPYCTYVAVYTVMVVFVGQERGGWSDFYWTMAFWPPWVSLILMLTIGFVIAVIMRLIHNKRAKQSRLRVSRSWSRNLGQTKLLIEAFGLGRYIGSKCSIEELTVPLDIFRMMSEQYDVSVESLTKAYVKGAIDAIEERQKK